MSRVALVIGGLSTAAASLAALFMAKRSATATKDAVSGASPLMAAGGSNAIELHLTGYWPFQSGLSASERKMEGAPVDRRGKPLHTVEDFFAGDSDHVSLSGDPEIFPYGQRINIPWGDKALLGRVTDTGGHFHGAGKVFRVVGAEPIDVCVASSATVIPKKTVMAQVVVGDHLDKPSKQLALDKAGKPQVSVGYRELFDEMQAARRAVEDAGRKRGQRAPYKLKAIYQEDGSGRVALVYRDGDGAHHYVMGTPAIDGLELLGAEGA